MWLVGPGIEMENTEGTGMGRGVCAALGLASYDAGRQLEIISH